MKVRMYLCLSLAVILAGCYRPQITEQPVSKTVNPGTDVSFSVAAKNACSISWKKDGEIIPDTLGNVLTLSAVTEKDEGAYQATAKSGRAYTDSELATLTVNDPVVITTQPLSQTVAPGAYAVLGVAVTGTAPFFCRWFRNDQELPDATGLTLEIDSANLIDIGTYFCEVNNVVNQPAVSGQATLRLTGYPAFGIAFTAVPEYGTSDLLYGVVFGVNPDDYKVVIYNESTWGYWIKPYLAWPLTYIEPLALDSLGSNFYCDVTTGANDNMALGYVAELLPNGVSPTLCMGNNGGSGGVPCPTEPNTPGAIAKCVVHRLETKTIEAFGLLWDVKYSYFPTDPGQHPFSNADSDVFVDADGYIHLISREGTSVEIVSQQSFGYGVYIFQVQGLAQIMDINRTLGLFLYELLSEDPAHREIDILELAKWGDPLNPTNAQYVLQPCNACPGCANCSRFSIDETGDFTTYLVWTPGHIEMRTYQGNYLGSAPPDIDLVAQWSFDGPEVPEPTPDVKVDINVWLLTGKDPATVPVQEVVLTGFTQQQEIPWLAGDAPTVSVAATATDVTAGAPVTFTATATGTAPLSYLWKKDGSALSGKTAATLVLNPTQLSDTGDYTCAVTNDFGSTESLPVHLTVNAAAPLITSQPVSQTKNPGEQATFLVVASGGLAPLEYQWYQKIGTTTTAVTGAKSPTLVVSNITKNDQAGYFCRVTNAVGPVKMIKVAKSS